MSKTPPRGKSANSDLAPGGAPGGAPAERSNDLTYSEYINDRAIIEALRLPSKPANVPSDRWPDLAQHAPGADWPKGRAWEHEEVLFIRTHQAFEVWFSLVLHEVGSVVEEIADVWRKATGHPPPRADLGGRRVEEDAFDPRRFPALAAAVAEAGKRYGADRARKLSAMGAPGRVVEPSPLELDATSAATLTEALQRGRERLLRSRAAIATTIPFYDVLATMTPAQFLRFRDRLQPASGFGSGQFRELELLLGLRELHHARLRPPPEHGPDGEPRVDPDLPAPLLRPTTATPAFLAEACFVRTLAPFMLERVARRWRDPSLRDVVYALLAEARDRESAALLGVPAIDTAAVDRFAARVVASAMEDVHRMTRPGPLDPESEERVAEHVRDVDAALAHRETIAAALIEMHGSTTPLRGFLDAALSLDGAILQWRDRHIRFVEGIIGIRRGTGGGGLRYLRSTVDAQRETFLTHALPALWQARTFVQRVEG